jgi:hypothetical protein
MKLKSLILLVLVSSLFMACQKKESANLAVSSIHRMSKSFLTC